LYSKYIISPIADDPCSPDPPDREDLGRPRLNDHDDDDDDDNDDNDNDNNDDNDEEDDR
jgi:hypothetical protein